jgi:hypothetical protein
VRDIFVTQRPHGRWVMRHPPLAPVLVCVAVVCVGPAAWPSDREAKTPPAAARREVPSVFFVAKSENRNQVHYGVALDADCAPLGDAPVFAYWRMRERGPLATEPLLSREVPAYGIASQHVVERGPTGGRVVLTLNAVPNRAIAIDTRTASGECTATARATIAGVGAALSSVYVQLRWPFGVDYLMLYGRSDADGRSVQERMR